MHPAPTDHYTLSLHDALPISASWPTACSPFEESVSILRNAGDEPSLARSLGGLAWLESDYRRARKLWNDTLTIQRRLANRENVGWTLIQVGHCSQGEGDYSAARLAYEESLAIAR